MLFWRLIGAVCALKLTPALQPYSMKRIKAGPLKNGRIGKTATGRIGQAWC
jgi:hypothetical protein